MGNKRITNIYTSGIFDVVDNNLNTLNEEPNEDYLIKTIYELKKFYKNLMISEANHYTTFLQFAREYQDRDIVDKKWHTLLKYEAEMMKVRGTTAKIHG